MTFCLFSRERKIPDFSKCLFLEIVFGNCGRKEGSGPAFDDHSVGRKWQLNERPAGLEKSKENRCGYITTDRMKKCLLLTTNTILSWYISSLLEKFCFRFLPSYSWKKTKIKGEK
jgi:hypothetical protein